MSWDTGRVAVLGAGTMGHGIAQVAAAAGYDAVLYDPDGAALERARDRVRQNLNKGVARGKVTEAERDATLERLTTSSSVSEAAAGARLVVEAAPERMELKRALFAEAGSAAPDDVILASNTSSLSLTEIAAAAPDPSRVVGMHFFNPVHIMKLLELVRAEQTTDEVVQAARVIGTCLGKTTIVVNDSAGFATSRLGLVLGLEAIRMVEQGVATPEDIDTAMELGYRHPMGPLKLTDLVGLDVRLAIAEYLQQEIGDQFRPPQLLRKMVRAGRLGKKSGRGFYDWSE